MAVNVGQFLTNEEESCNGRYVVREKDAENNIDWACEQRGSFVENGN